MLNVAQRTQRIPPGHDNNNNHPHHFRKEDFTILSREANYHARGIKESIFIRALSPSINREEARHNLPRNYDSLIRDNLKKPLRPRAHQPGEPRLHTAPRGPGRPRTQPTEPAEDTMRPETMPSIAADTAIENAAAPAGVRQRQPPTHGMVTRRQAARVQEDRGTPD